MTKDMKRAIDRRLFAILCVIFLTLAIPSIRKALLQPTLYFDFDVYHRTALRFLRFEWSALWNLVLDGNCPYRYSPWTLFFVAPLGFFSLPVARGLFITFTAVLFAWGVRTLIRTAEEKQQTGAVAAGLIASLFGVRYVLDTFRMGQVNGVLFICFVFAFSGLATQRAGRAAVSSTVAALFKIGPGVSILPALFAFPLQVQLKWILRIAATLLGSALVLALLRAQTSPDSVSDSFVRLFRDWWPMVAGDSQFFEAGHYGNQSIKGAILRAGLGQLSIPVMDRIWLASVGFIVGLTSFQFYRARDRLHEFRIASLASSLATILFVLCMPHTFKFNCSALILPFFALLMIDRKDPVVWTLGVLQLVFSRDLVGGENYDWIYKHSLPLLTYVGIYGWLMVRLNQALRAIPFSSEIQTERAAPTTR